MIKRFELQFLKKNSEKLQLNFILSESQNTKKTKTSAADTLFCLIRSVQESQNNSIDFSI